MPKRKFEHFVSGKNKVSYMLWGTACVLSSPQQSMWRILYLSSKPYLSEIHVFTLMRILICHTTCWVRPLFFLKRYILKMSLSGRIAFLWIAIFLVQNVFSHLRHLHCDGAPSGHQCFVSIPAFRGREIKFAICCSSSTASWFCSCFSNRTHLPDVNVSVRSAFSSHLD